MTPNDPWYFFKPYHEVGTFGYELNVSKIVLTNMGFGADIHVLLRVNYKNFFGEPKCLICEHIKHYACQTLAS